MKLNLFSKLSGLITVATLATNVHARWVGVDGKKYYSAEQCFDTAPPCYSDKAVKPDRPVDANVRLSPGSMAAAATERKYGWCASGNCWGTFPACEKRYGGNCKRTLLE